jgi:DNA invertase Pin-like site-specific DNA recombinase
MDDIRKRKLDGVLVWRFDRFARSTKHLLTALDEFRSAGIQFISYQENMDTASPLGQALFTIVAAVAQLERDLIRERVTAGIYREKCDTHSSGVQTAPCIYFRAFHEYCIVMHPYNMNECTYVSSRRE